MTREDIKKYKNELESELMKHMANTGNMCERFANAVDSMVKCWMHVTEMENMIKKDFEFTPEKAENWLLHMENEDGTTGAHWSLKETDAYKPSDVNSYVWECAMNMMYSDYYSVAIAHGVNTPEFYADMANAFLFDRDAKSPEKKIAAYYNCIVEV